MKWLYNFLLFCIGFSSFFGVLFLVATTYGWEKIWESRIGPADMGPIEFEGFTKGPNPNHALICPDGICAEYARDRASPVYNLPVAQLHAALLNSIENEESLERVDDGSDALALRFVQRSRVFRFPDTIRVRLYGLTDAQSTLAIYSQSQVGKYDFGENSARVKRWLGRISQYQKSNYSKPPLICTINCAKVTHLMVLF